MRNTRRISFIVVAVLINFSLACGGAPSTSPPQKAKELEKLLNALVGTWSISEDDGTGKVTQGEEVWRLEPGGGPLIEEYHSKTATGENAYDFAVFWWDAKTTQYQGIFCADFNDQGCTPFQIKKAEGDKIEMTGEYWSSGKRFFWREVFDVTTPTSFTQILELGPARAKLKVASTIHATRVAK